MPINQHIWGTGRSKPEKAALENEVNFDVSEFVGATGAERPLLICD